MWVLPVPLLPTAMTFSRRWMYSQRASSATRTIAKSGEMDYKERETREGSVWIWVLRNLYSSACSRCRTPGGPGECAIPFKPYCV